jgi:hypothetical protein
MKTCIKEFTWKNIATQLMWSGIMIGLSRLALLAFGDKPHYEYLYWLVGIALVFMIMTFLSALLKSDSRPAFQVSLEEVVVGSVDLRDKKDVSFASVIASIANIGAPSVIKGITFSVLVPGGMPVGGMPQTIQDGMKVSRPDGQPERVSAKDALNIKAQTDPIPKGGMVRGRMLYLIPQVSPNNLGAIGTEFKMFITDLWGKKYMATLTRQSDQWEKLDFPQIESRFLGDAKQDN